MIIALNIRIPMRRYDPFCANLKFVVMLGVKYSGIAITMAMLIKAEVINPTQTSFLPFFPSFPRKRESRVEKYFPINTANKGKQGSIYGTNLDLDSEKKTKINTVAIKKNNSFGFLNSILFIAPNRNPVQGKRPSNKMGI